MSGSGHNRSIFPGEMGRAHEEYLDYLEQQRNKKLRKALMSDTVKTFASSFGWGFGKRQDGSMEIHRIDRDTFEVRLLVVHCVEGGNGKIRKVGDGFEIDLDPEKVFDRDECDEYLHNIFRAMGRKPKVML